MSKQFIKYASILVAVIAITQQKVCLCGKTKGNFSATIDYTFETTNSYVMKLLNNTIQEIQDASNESYLLPILKFKEIGEMNQPLRQGNQKSDQKNGFEFEVLIGSGKQSLFENNVLFQVDEQQKKILTQMIEKNWLDSQESQRIKIPGKTFKKLTLSNQKRIFAGFDICQNFLMFVRKFTKQILNHINQAIIEQVRNSESLQKAKAKWQRYDANFKSQFLDVSKLSSKDPMIEGCDKPIDQNLFKELQLIQLSQYQLVRYKDNLDRSIYYLTSKRKTIPKKLSITKAIKKKYDQVESIVKNQMGQGNKKSTVKKQLHFEQGATRKSIAKPRQPSLVQNSSANIKKVQPTTTNTGNQGVTQLRQSIIGNNVKQTETNIREQYKGGIPKLKFKVNNQNNQQVEQNNINQYTGKIPKLKINLNKQNEQPNDNQNTKQQHQFQSNIPRLIPKTNNQNEDPSSNNNVPQKLKFDASKIPRVQINLPQNTQNNEQRQQQILQHMRDNKKQINERIQNLKIKYGQKNQGELTQDNNNKDVVEDESNEQERFNQKYLQKKQNSSNHITFSEQRTFSQQDLSDQSLEYSRDSQEQQQTLNADLLNQLDNLNGHKNKQQRSDDSTLAQIDDDDQQYILEFIQEEVNLVEQNQNDIQSIQITPMEPSVPQFEYHDGYILRLLINNQPIDRQCNDIIKEYYNKITLRDQATGNIITTGQEVEGYYTQQHKNLIQMLLAKQAQQVTKTLDTENMAKLNINDMPRQSKIFSFDFEKGIDHYMCKMYQIKKDRFFLQQNLLQSSELVYDHKGATKQDMNVLIEQHILQNQLQKEYTYQPLLIMLFIEFIEDKNIDFKVYYNEQNKIFFTSLQFTYENIGQESLLYQYFQCNSYDVEIEIEFVNFTFSKYILNYYSDDQQLKQIEVSDNGDHIQGLEKLSQKEKDSAYNLLLVMITKNDEQAETARFFVNNWDRINKRRRMVRRMLLRLI